MNTKGITISAGGSTYFLNAYVNIRLLRNKGCNLPVSWFYLGDEMKPEWIQLAEEIPNVKTYDLGGTGDHKKDKGGWQSKIEAVIQSPFDEVLLLDADSFPIRNPEYLFEHPYYKETNAVLWPDVWEWQPERLKFLNDKYNINLNGTRQIESGQAMFNKPNCMDALIAVRKLNQESAETYKIVYGDKDTFLIGFLQVNCSFKIVTTLPSCFQNGLFQYDFNGNKLFSHLTGGKFQWHGRSFVSEENLPGALLASKIIKAIK